LREDGLQIVMDPVMAWYGGGPPPGPYGAFDLEAILRMSEALQVVSISAIGPFQTGEVPFGKLVESFAGLCDRATELGVDVQLEFMPITAIADVATASAIVDGAGRRNGGLVVDTWHFFRGNPDLSAFDRVPGERVFAVQVADALAETRGNLVAETFDRMLPGDGELDLASVLRTLDRIGGLRWVGPEVISPVTAAMAPTDAARIAGGRVRDLIRGIRSHARPDAP
jgi:sugar phosphate isomerase/epimerase